MSHFCGGVGEREETEYHHCDHDFGSSYRFGRKVFQKRLDRLPLAQRLGDLSLRLRDRNRVHGVTRIASRRDFPLEITERPAQDEAIGDRANAFENQRRSGKKEDTFFGRDGNVLGERRGAFVERKQRNELRRNPFAQKGLAP